MTQKVFEKVQIGDAGNRFLKESRRFSETIRDPVGIRRRGRRKMIDRKKTHNIEQKRDL